MFSNTINLSQILTIQNFVIYMVIINFIAFFAMWIDKRKAEKGKWRISEKALFTLVLLGGGLGGILGMYMFRQKTKKMAFVIGFPLIFVLEVILVCICIL